MQCRASELSAHLDGELVGPDAHIDGASIDSRTLRAGQLYVPVVAERDGHDFIPAAVEAGAAAYLTAREPIGGTAIRVADTGRALLNLGRWARSRVATTIGVTGSVGKTTTKDLLAGCLGSTFRTFANEQSFNNELGLPLTLLNAARETEFVVLEMGARRIGDIALLADVAHPDIGIVTRVARAHVEYFGDLAGVARAKSELVDALPTTGLAVLNFDDERVRAMAQRSACPTLGYSVDGNADVRADSVTLDRNLRPHFRLSSPWGNIEVQLAVHGHQQVSNALAAAGAALWCGVHIDAVGSALTTTRASELRMELRRPPGGPTLVVDCYNANPTSTEAALCSLAALPAARRLALLGPMAELGRHGPSEHRRMARIAERLGVDLIGYRTDLYGASVATGVAEAVTLLRTRDPADAILIKGSRVAQLEEVVEAYEHGQGAGQSLAFQ